MTKISIIFENSKFFSVIFTIPQNLCGYIYFTAKFTKYFARDAIHENIIRLLTTTKGIEELLIVNEIES